jgi:Nucleoside-diphosphate-sugar epimerases
VPEFDVRDRVVMVTGGRGFLGSEVCRLLAARGAIVHAVGSADYDLTQQSEVRRAMSEVRPSVVVHAAAAVGGIGANVANPGLFLYANALMGLMVLEEARLHGVDRLILVSTICVYPEHAPIPLREEDVWSGPPVGATGPYGMAKRLLHEACARYTEQYGFDSSVLILTNLYGPGDDFDESSSHVIPALIRRYDEARQRGDASVTNWGTGRATREFLHVRDAARAIVRAVEVGPGPRPINIGTGAQTSIAEISEVIQRATRFTGEVRWDASKPEGQPRRYFDVSRAREELGFAAVIGLEEGIPETVGSYHSTLSRTPTAS